MGLYPHCFSYLLFIKWDWLATGHNGGVVLFYLLYVGPYHRPFFLLHFFIGASLSSLTLIHLVRIINFYVRVLHRFPLKSIFVPSLRKPLS
jgi:hypothetical protein